MSSRGRCACCHQVKHGMPAVSQLVIPDSNHHIPPRSPLHLASTSLKSIKHLPLTMFAGMAPPCV